MCIRDRLYALILRECTSNGVRHAGATELYADSEHRPQSWHLCITNNGAPPKAEIKEGGGLSSLRRRIENAGGTVTVHSLPVFVLEVTLPDKAVSYTHLVNHSSWPCSTWPLACRLLGST